MILLTDKEMATSIGTDHTIHGFVVEAVDFQRVAKAQLAKIAKWIRERPTDGWDKWHFYNIDLAQNLL